MSANTEESNVMPGRLVYLPDFYSDAPAITDEKGFTYVDVPGSAILLDYAHKLGIDHWAHDPRASVTLSDELQHNIARRLVACWNQFEGISTANIEDNKPVKWLAEEYNKALKLIHTLTEHHKAMLTALKSASEAIGAFEDQEGFMPQDTPEFRDLREALHAPGGIAQAILLASYLPKTGGEG